MEIIKETKEKIVNMEFDMSVEEQEIFVEHAWNLMPLKKIRELCIEWAMNDILEKVMEDWKNETD